MVCMEEKSSVRLTLNLETEVSRSKPAHHQTGT
jgi:hypothetical protein